jgi:hypothetical protein
MINKNNKTKCIVKTILAMLLVTSVRAVNAESIVISAAPFDVKSSTGVSIVTNLGAKFGFFASGFVASSANLAQWDENFISMNGRWTASTKTFGISLSAGDNNIGSGSQTGSTAFNVAIPVNTQLLLLVSNVAYSSAANTTSSVNADYLLPQSSITAKTVEYAVLTDSSWKMISTSAAGVNNTTVGFTANTGIYGGFGSYSSVTSAITLIPEPSSASLLGLGVAGLVALRVRRKS